MSLNRHEQAVFDYWDKHIDERRHWQAKIAGLAHGPTPDARALERELWDYFVERSPHVAGLRELHAGGTRRVSLLNLAEHVIRLWVPRPKPKKAVERQG